MPADLPEPERGKLIAELARLFGAEEGARDVLEAAGIDRGRLPAFTGADSFWRAVLRELHLGRCGDAALSALIHAALKKEYYPGNDVLRQVARALAPSGHVGRIKVRTNVGVHLRDESAVPSAEELDEIVRDILRRRLETLSLHGSLRFAGHPFQELHLIEHREAGVAGLRSEDVRVTLQSELLRRAVLAEVLLLDHTFEDRLLGAIQLVMPGLVTLEVSGLPLSARVGILAWQPLIRSVRLLEAAGAPPPPLDLPSLLDAIVVRTADPGDSTSRRPVSGRRSRLAAVLTSGSVALQADGDWEILQSHDTLRDAGVTTGSVLQIEQLPQVGGRRGTGDDPGQSGFPPGDGGGDRCLLKRPTAEVAMYSPNAALRQPMYELHGDPGARRERVSWPALPTTLRPPAGAPDAPEVPRDAGAPAAPDAAPPTLPDLLASGFIAEMAAVFSTEYLAASVLGRVGVPDAFPDFSSVDAEHYWTLVGRVAERSHTDGLSRLIAACAELMPGNPVFRAQCRRDAGASQLFRDPLDASRTGTTIEVRIPSELPLPQILELIDGSGGAGRPDREPLVTRGSTVLRFYYENPPPEELAELERQLAAELERRGLELAAGTPGASGATVTARENQHRDFYLDPIWIAGPEGRVWEATELRASTMVKDVVQFAVEEYAGEWPAARDGAPRSAAIDVEAADGSRRRLDPNHTLFEAGVRPGDRLQFAPESTAG